MLHEYFVILWHSEATVTDVAWVFCDAATPIFHCNWWCMSILWCCDTRRPLQQMLHEYFVMLWLPEATVTDAAWVGSYGEMWGCGRLNQGEVFIALVIWSAQCVIDSQCDWSLMAICSTLLPLSNLIRNTTFFPPSDFLCCLRKASPWIAMACFGTIVYACTFNWSILKIWLQ